MWPLARKRADETKYLGGKTKNLGALRKDLGGETKGMGAKAKDCTLGPL